MPVAVGCDRERDAEGRLGEQFLMELFEHEYCAECGGDHWEHLAFPNGLGSWHAMCLRVDPGEGPSAMQERWMTTVPARAEGLVHCQDWQCEAAWSPNLPSDPIVRRVDDLSECPLCGGTNLELSLPGGHLPRDTRRPNGLVHEGERDLEL